MKITIQELSKSFGGRDIFSNFSLEVDSGVRLCVCGPNGTGKSTFLRLLAGVDSIRDVIAFPKSGGGFDPLTEAPATITAQQRKEAGVDAKPEPKKD